MKLWILRPIEDLPAEDNPWEPWYDKAFGFVVRAETETDARDHAHQDAGDENRGEFMGRAISATNSPWLDPKYTTCLALMGEGDSGVIIKDFASA